ncbi:hypothetical protein [Atlantibacter subterraneus]|uniref:hypothetical protein n=1 Tax=Atlantibacter subterraneus TaxID=255519 RepID=UPI002FDD86BD
MQDLFFETIALKRIGLLVRFAAQSKCTGGEKDLVLSWLSELTDELEQKLDAVDTKNPLSGGISDSRGGLQ